MKKTILAVLAAMACTGANAGGYLTNTNLSAAFLRNPSRDAVIAIDGLYTNPAGVMFLEPGFHLQFDLQSAYQTRTVESTFAPFANGLNNSSATKKYEGNAQAPVIPSFHLAYNWERWSLNFSFGLTGGGGKCEFDDGLGSFESVVSVMPYLINKANPALPATSKYSFDSYMRGRQYYFGGQLGGNYKVNDNLAVFAGARVVYATTNYYGYVRNINFYPIPGNTSYVVPDPTGKDISLNCDQTGWGITPIIGVDWKINDKWNLAAKYEFPTRLELENQSINSSDAQALPALDQFKDGKKVREDIPGILFAGAQYSPIDPLRLSAGFHYYWDKDAKKYGNTQRNLDGNTWEISAGVEYDFAKNWTASAGWQTTNYGNTDAYMKDLSFNTNSNSIGLGVSWKVSKKVTLDAGYFITLYKHYEKNSDNFNGVKETVEGTIAQSVAQQMIAGGYSPEVAAQAAPAQAAALVAADVAADKISFNGKDDFHRTNNVFGIGVTLDF